MHCSTTSRCTKSPVSPSSVISAQPADKWAVNRINSGHMYSPVFNYLAVNLAKEVRVTAQHSSSSCRCVSELLHAFSALTSLPHNSLFSHSSSQTLGQWFITPITFALGQDGKWTGLCGTLTERLEQHSRLYTDFMECSHTLTNTPGATVGSASSQIHFGTLGIKLLTF